MCLQAFNALTLGGEGIQQRGEPITVNDTEKQTTNQFKLVLSFQIRTEINPDSDVSWHPQKVTCICLYVHICVCAHMCVCVVYSFGGESLSSGGPGWLPFTLPTLTDLCLHSFSLSLRFLPFMSLLSQENTLNSTETFQELEKDIFRRGLKSQP